MTTGTEPLAEKRARLDEPRRKLREAEAALAAAEREYGAVAREVHDPACRYFNGMDMTCTCGVDP
jgi:hypothetical protein